jgi:signal transduction histidine kinase
MRERASEVGGGFRVESRPGDGACVEIAIPREEPS